MKCCRNTYGYTWPVSDNDCRAGDTHMDKRGKWVTVSAVLAIHKWIHVGSVVKVAAVLAINIWKHVASRVTLAAVLAIYIWIHVASV